MSGEFLFPEMRLSEGLVRDLRRMNPWWEGQPQAPLPTTQRHLVGAIQQRLEQRLAPLVLVRGPRQIGKTVAQQQLIERMLLSGLPPQHIFRLQCDELPELTKLSEPILRLVDWYEDTILGRKLNAVAREGARTYLFFDEVQNLKDWAPQLKALVDSTAIQGVVTGSSALRIEQGRDSLAGRVSTIEAGVLSLTEIANFHGIELCNPFLPDNGIAALSEQAFWKQLTEYGRDQQTARDRAFDLFASRGGYPLAHSRPDVPWADLAAQLNETVIRRVIQHDLRVGERGRKRDPQLLEEIFRMACRYVGQSPAPTTLARETQRALGANVGPQRVLQYLRFLGDTLLLRLIEPLEIRLKRRRGAAKICLADHGLRASWLGELVPLTLSELAAQPHLSTLAGRIAESIVGAMFSTIGNLHLTHLPERREQPEIDFVLTIGTQRIPVEVKFRARIDPHRDTEGLRTFLETTVNQAPFGVLITLDQAPEVTDPRIVAVPLSTVLLLR